MEADKKINHDPSLGVIGLIDPSAGVFPSRVNRRLMGKAETFFTCTVFQHKRRLKKKNFLYIMSHFKLREQFNILENTLICFLTDNNTTLSVCVANGSWGKETVEHCGA